MKSLRYFLFIGAAALVLCVFFWSENIQAIEGARVSAVKDTSRGSAFGGISEVIAAAEEEAETTFVLMEGGSFFGRDTLAVDVTVAPEDSDTKGKCASLEDPILIALCRTMRNSKIAGSLSDSFGKINSLYMFPTKTSGTTDRGTCEVDCNGTTSVKKGENYECAVEINIPENYALTKIICRPLFYVYEFGGRYLEGSKSRNGYDVMSADLRAVPVIADAANKDITLPSEIKNPLYARFSQDTSGFLDSIKLNDGTSVPTVGQEIDVQCNITYAPVIGGSINNYGRKTSSCQQPEKEPILFKSAETPLSEKTREFCQDYPFGCVTNVYPQQVQEAKKLLPLSVDLGALDPTFAGDEIQYNIEYTEQGNQFSIKSMLSVLSDEPILYSTYTINDCANPKPTPRDFSGLDEIGKFNYAIGMMYGSDLLCWGKDQLEELKAFGWNSSYPDDGHYTLTSEDNGSVIEGDLCQCEDSSLITTPDGGSTPIDLPADSDSDTKTETSAAKSGGGCSLIKGTW